MSDFYSDRWLRWFEEQHPRLKSSQEPQSHQVVNGTAPVSQAMPQVPARLNETACATNLSLRNNSRPVSAGMSQPSSREPGPASVEELIIEVLALRLRLNMSQRAFAQKLGISSRTYQDWEQGRRRPSGPARILLERGLLELGSDH